ncbi:hypothetical protein [Mesorhizobium sp. J428]|uniref:hypothetical protein n=1 Tax=Mesorhizobium sp. J428 TaxID=2898440 RepID=UPI002150D801|nr:hypothetical protein [Mesorhizobium sp. J428]MCR5858297.1 hypothetical protein [Mesorhizobium sp. J428]
MKIKYLIVLSTVVLLAACNESDTNSSSTPVSTPAQPVPTTATRSNIESLTTKRAEVRKEFLRAREEFLAADAALKLKQTELEAAKEADNETGVPALNKELAGLKLTRGNAAAAYLTARRDYVDLVNRLEGPKQVQN